MKTMKGKVKSKQISSVQHPMTMHGTRLRPNSARQDDAKALVAMGSERQINYKD